MQKSGIFNLVDRFCTFIFNLNNHTFGLLEIYCPALEVPFRGLVAPASCTDDRASIRRNTVCSYGCVSGHYIAGGITHLSVKSTDFGMEMYLIVNVSVSVITCIHMGP